MHFIVQTLTLACMLIHSICASTVISVTSYEELASVISAFQTKDLVISISGRIHLSSQLSLNHSHDGLILTGSDEKAQLLLTSCSSPSSVVKISGLTSLRIQNLFIGYEEASVARGLYPGALVVEDSWGVSLAHLRVEGGVRISGGGNNRLSYSEISNARGAQNGTCIYVPHCGYSPTLTSCNLTIHDNYVHDCRWDGTSPYVASAQGVLLGAQDGGAVNASVACTVGVVVEHNNINGTDEMGARVTNDYLCAAALNQVVFNFIENWGQLGGGNTDDGCLYLYGHWYSPGNNFSFNFCASRNASWGQNGLYLDDAATGATAVGNVFFNQSGGVGVKLNGGSFNTVRNNLIIQGIGMGFAVCRGLRPPLAYIYTCQNNNTGVRWMKVLYENNFTGEPWKSTFPFYKDWCTVQTTGPNAYPCAPPGAPSAYECAILPRGNEISLFGGVGMRRNSSFAIPTSPGFPFLDPRSPCADFVVEQEFNHLGSSAFVGDLEANFVDSAKEDFTLKPNAPLFEALPGFMPIPFREIGARNFTQKK